MGVNPGEGMVQAKAAKHALAVNPIEGAVRAENEPRFKSKCSGSLIPPKRRLVKHMMFECIGLRTIASCFHPTSANNKKHACKNKKKICSVVQDGAAQSNSSSSLITKP